MKPPEQTVSPAEIGWMPVHGAPGVEHLAVAGELCLSTSQEFETASRMFLKKRFSSSSI
jgi:hypothetical protein